MTKKRIFLGILAIALVFGMIVLGAKPPPEIVKPDKNSSVVYFIGYKSDKPVVWDGETPVADFAKGSRIGIVPWKTKPGDHYFMANAFTWVAVRARLKPNKTYYVKLDWIPNPIPFAKNIIVFRELDQEDGEKWVNKYQPSLFTDEWRAKFAQGETLKEAKEQLQKARADKSIAVILN